MYRFALLLALPACTITTSHSASPGAYPRPTAATTTAASSPQPGSPPGSGQNAPRLDERAALYEKAPVPDEPARPLDPTPRDCSTDANHCLRGGWMVTGGNNYLHAEFPAIQVAPRGDTFVPYAGPLPKRRIAAYQTVRATAARLDEMRRAFVFVPAGPWPRSEAEMLVSARWFEVSVHSVDAAAGTFVAGEIGTFPIADARVWTDVRGAN